MENIRVDNTQNILIQKLGLSAGYTPNSQLKDIEPPKSGDCFYREGKKE